MVFFIDETQRFCYNSRTALLRESIYGKQRKYTRMKWGQFYHVSGSKTRWGNRGFPNGKNYGRNQQGL